MIALLSRDFCPMQRLRIALNSIVNYRDLMFTRVGGRRPRGCVPSGKVISLGGKEQSNGVFDRFPRRKSFSTRFFLPREIDADESFLLSPDQVGTISYVSFFFSSPAGFRSRLRFCIPSSVRARFSVPLRLESRTRPPLDSPGFGAVLFGYFQGGSLNGDPALTCFLARPVASPRLACINSLYDTEEIPSPYS